MLPVANRRVFNSNTSVLSDFWLSGIVINPNKRNLMPQQKKHDVQPLKSNQVWTCSFRHPKQKTVSSSTTALFWTNTHAEVWEICFLRSQSTPKSPLWPQKWEVTTSHAQHSLEFRLGPNSDFEHEKSRKTCKSRDSGPLVQYFVGSCGFLLLLPSTRYSGRG